MKSVITAAIIVGLSLSAVPAAARQGKKEARAASGESSQPLAIPVGPTYIIQPDDVLDVSVWKEPDISFRGLPVRPDGKISLPLINDVQAAGLTAEELADNITRELKKYVEDPQVTVVVTQVNSQRYYVLGEVAHAGVFPLLPGIRVLQALSAAGGFSQFANLKKIYVLRNENGTQHKFPFNYKEVVAGQNLQENIQLKPGDTIIIP